MTVARNASANMFLSSITSYPILKDVLIVQEMFDKLKLSVSLIRISLCRAAMLSGFNCSGKASGLFC